MSKSFKRMIDEVSKRLPLDQDKELLQLFAKIFDEGGSEAVEAKISLLVEEMGSV